MTGGGGQICFKHSYVTQAVRGHYQLPVVGQEVNAFDIVAQHKDLIVHMAVTLFESHEKAPVFLFGHYRVEAYRKFAQVFFHIFFREHNFTDRHEFGLASIIAASASLTLKPEQCSNPITLHSFTTTFEMTVSYLPFISIRDSHR